MAMVNNLVNVKDSRWLQLEVCREFQRNKCTRPDTECKFAHPPPNVEVQNGRVTACYDSIKGRCNREKPPCKYFHPPQHLKDQLLINGRNHLALKNALMQQMPLQPMLPGQLPAVVGGKLQIPTGLTGSYIMGATTHPYVTSIPTVATASNFNPYLNPNPIMSLVPAEAVGTPLNVVPTPIVTTQKLPRTDRLEVCREFQRGNCKRAENECRFAHPPEHVTVDSNDGMVTVCMDFLKGRCSREQCRYFHPPPHLQAQLKAVQSRANAAAMPQVIEIGKKRPHDPTDDFILAIPGMIPYNKRPAVEKSGVPVYQPGTTAYQQALAMQLQQPFVPVTFDFKSNDAHNIRVPNPALFFAGHPPGVPRF